MDLTVEEIRKLAKKDLSKANYPLYLNCNHTSFLLLSVDGLSIVNPEALKELNLSHNQLRDLGTLLQRFIALKRLFLSHNALQTVAVRSLSTLVVLDLSNNLLRDVPNLAGLHHLRECYLDHNQISKCDAEDTFSPCMDTLCILDLSFNDLDWGFDELESALKSFYLMPQLRHISLRENPLEKKCLNYQTVFSVRVPQLQTLDSQSLTNIDRKTRPARHTNSSTSGQISTEGVVPVFAADMRRHVSKLNSTRKQLESQNPVNMRLPDEPQHDSSESNGLHAQDSSASGIQDDISQMMRKRRQNIRRTFLMADNEGAAEMEGPTTITEQLQRDMSNFSSGFHSTVLPSNRSTHELEIKSDEEDETHGPPTFTQFNRWLRSILASGALEVWLRSQVSGESLSADDASKWKKLQICLNQIEEILIDNLNYEKHRGLVRLDYEKINSSENDLTCFVSILQKVIRDVMGGHAQSSKPLNSTSLPWLSLCTRCICRCIFFIPDEDTQTQQSLAQVLTELIASNRHVCNLILQSFYEIVMPTLNNMPIEVIYGHWQGIIEIFNAVMLITAEDMTRLSDLDEKSDSDGERKTVRSLDTCGLNFKRLRSSHSIHHVQDLVIPEMQPMLFIVLPLLLEQIEGELNEITHSLLHLLACSADIHFTSKQGQINEVTKEMFDDSTLCTHILRMMNETTDPQTRILLLRVIATTSPFLCQQYFVESVHVSLTRQLSHSLLHPNQLQQAQANNSTANDSDMHAEEFALTCICLAEICRERRAMRELVFEGNFIQQLCDIFRMSTAFNIAALCGAYQALFVLLQLSNDGERKIILSQLFSRLSKATPLIRILTLEDNIFAGGASTIGSALSTIVYIVEILRMMCEIGERKPVAPNPNETNSISTAFPESKHSKIITKSYEQLVKNSSLSLAIRHVISHSFLRRYPLIVDTCLRCLSAVSPRYLGKTVEAVIEIFKSPLEVKSSESIVVKAQALQLLRSIAVSTRKEDVPSNMRSAVMHETLFLRSLEILHELVRFPIPSHRGFSSLLNACVSFIDSFSTSHLSVMTKKSRSEAEFLVCRILKCEEHVTSLLSEETRLETAPISNSPRVLLKCLRFLSMDSPVYIRVMLQLCKLLEFHPPPILDHHKASFLVDEGQQAKLDSFVERRGPEIIKYLAQQIARKGLPRATSVDDTPTPIREVSPATEAGSSRTVTTPPISTSKDFSDSTPTSAEFSQASTSSAVLQTTISRDRRSLTKRISSVGESADPVIPRDRRSITSNSSQGKGHSRRFSSTYKMTVVSPVTSPTSFGRHSERGAAQYENLLESDERTAGPIPLAFEFDLDVDADVFLDDFHGWESGAGSSQAPSKAAITGGHQNYGRICESVKHELKQQLDGSPTLRGFIFDMNGTHQSDSNHQTSPAGNRDPADEDELSLTTSHSSLHEDGDENDTDDENEDGASDPELMNDHRHVDMSPREDGITENNNNNSDSLVHQMLVLHEGDDETHLTRLRSPTFTSNKKLASLKLVTSESISSIRTTERAGGIDSASSLPAPSVRLVSPAFTSIMMHSKDDDDDLSKDMFIRRIFLLMRLLLTWILSSRMWTPATETAASVVRQNTKLFHSREIFEMLVLLCERTNYSSLEVNLVILRLSEQLLRMPYGVGSNKNAEDDREEHAMLLEIVSQILRRIGSRVQSRIEAMLSVRNTHQAAANQCNLSDNEIRLIDQLSVTWQALVQQVHALQLFDGSKDVPPPSPPPPSDETKHITDNRWSAQMARLNQLSSGKLLQKLLPPEEIYSLVLLMYEMTRMEIPTHQHEQISTLPDGNAIWNVPQTAEREFQYGDNLAMGSVLRKVSQFAKTDCYALATSIVFHVMQVLKVYLVSDPLNFGRDVIEAFFSVESLYNLYGTTRTALTGGYLLDMILQLSLNHRQWSLLLEQTMNIGEESPHIIDHWLANVLISPALASASLPPNTIAEKRLIVFTDRALHILQPQPGTDSAEHDVISFEAVTSAQIGCGGKRWVIEFTFAGTKMRTVFGFSGHCNPSSLLDWIGEHKKAPGNIRRSVVSTYTLFGSMGIDELVWTALERLIGIAESKEKEIIRFFTFVRRTPVVQGQSTNDENELILVLTSKRLLLLRDDIRFYGDPIKALIGGSTQDEGASTQSLLHLVESHDVANLSLPPKLNVSVTLRIFTSDSTTALDIEFEKPESSAFLVHLLRETA